jgi:hypothetical protein
MSGEEHNHSESGKYRLPARRRAQSHALAVEGHHKLESGSCVENTIA